MLFVLSGCESDYNRGYDNGNKEGYEKGVEEGTEKGLKKGYEDGQKATDSYQKGYDYGYMLGMSEKISLDIDGLSDDEYNALYEYFTEAIIENGSLDDFYYEKYSEEDYYDSPDYSEKDYDMFS